MRDDTLLPFSIEANPGCFSCRPLPPFKDIRKSDSTTFTGNPFFEDQFHAQFPPTQKAKLLREHSSLDAFRFGSSTKEIRLMVQRIMVQSAYWVKFLLVLFILQYRIVKMCHLMVQFLLDQGVSIRDCNLTAKSLTTVNG